MREYYYYYEKKRKYNPRATEIEQGTFTPLVFTTTGGMADECLRYHSRLAELLSAKKQRGTPQQKRSVFNHTRHRQGKRPIIRFRVEARARVAPILTPKNREI